MFGTDIADQAEDEGTFGTDIADQAGEEGMFGEGHSHWFKISRLLPTHWYHVDVKIRNEDRMTPLVLMAGDETAFKEILKKRGPDLELTQVQAVIPKWMNKTDAWSMEKLTGLSLGYDKIGIPVCLLEVASGAVYADVHDPQFCIDSLVEVKKIY
ncbi:hypothetical protein [Pseudomonas sp. BF-B-25]|nr:hypothetical protein [Pseudomonas sp. BF-B-25]